MLKRPSLLSTTPFLEPKLDLIKVFAKAFLVLLYCKSCLIRPSNIYVNWNMSGKNSKQNKICETIPSWYGPLCSFTSTAKPLQLTPNCYGAIFSLTANSWAWFSEFYGWLCVLPSSFVWTFQQSWNALAAKAIENIHKFLFQALPLLERLLMCHRKRKEK